METAYIYAVLIYDIENMSYDGVIIHSIRKFKNIISSLTYWKWE